MLPAGSCAVAFGRYRRGHGRRLHPSPSPGTPPWASDPAQASAGPVLHHRPAPARRTRGPADWVHTDPWRVLRIQAEFVEGFGLLAEIGARSPSSARRGPRRDHPEYELAARSAYALAKAGYAVITGGGPGVMEAANKGCVRGRGRLDRPGHRAAVRAGPQRLRRRRHQLPLLLRPQDDVRQVRPGLRLLARRLRHPRRAVRGPHPGPDPEDHPVPGRADGHRVLAGPARLGRHRCCPRARSRRTTWT